MIFCHQKLNEGMLSVVFGIDLPFLCFRLLIIVVFLLCRYQEYKSEYITTQKRAYFDAHKAEDWYFFASSLF